MEDPKLKYQEIVKRYKDYFGDKLIAVGIFGSVARNEEYPGSDLDIFLLVEELPKEILKRYYKAREPLFGIKHKYCLYPRTKEEFESAFPAIYLDFALDMIILYEKDNYLSKKLQRIRDIINEAGLYRVKLKNSYMWKWKNPPMKWEITWEGFRELP